MKQFYAYAHLRPDGTPFYIGKGFGKRSHEFTSGRTSHHRNIVAKHGRENIIVEVMPCRSEAEAFLREQLAIKALRRAGVKLVNITDGGEGCSGRPVSAETRAKIAASNRGKVRTPEMRERVSASKMGKPGIKGVQHMLGKKHSAETRAKMSLAALGNKRGIGNKGGLGRKLTDEHRAKLRAAWALRKSRKNNS